MKVGSTFIQIGDRKLEFFFRPETSDTSIIGQIFVDNAFDISKLARFTDLEKILRDGRLKGKRPLIIDAGANIGASSIYFSEQCRDSLIVAIEPEVSNFQLLKKNIQEMSVIPLPFALSATTGRMKIVDVGDGCWAFQTHPVSTEEEGDSIVECVTIPQIYNQFAKDYFPFIVKIDIEGAEKELFQSNTEWVAKTPLIICEPHDWLLPKKGTSKPFLEAIIQYDRDFVFLGENIFSIDNDLDSLNPVISEDEGQELIQTGENRMKDSNPDVLAHLKNGEKYCAQLEKAENDFRQAIKILRYNEMELEQELASLREKFAQEQERLQKETDERESYLNDLQVRGKALQEELATLHEEVSREREEFEYERERLRRATEEKESFANGLQVQKKALQQELTALHEETDREREEFAKEREQLRQKSVEKESVVNELEAREKEQQIVIHELHKVVAEQESSIFELREITSKVFESNSWKITAPLREYFGETSKFKFAYKKFHKWSHERLSPQRLFKAKRGETRKVATLLNREPTQNADYENGLGKIEVDLATLEAQGAFNQGWYGASAIQPHRYYRQPVSFTDTISNMASKKYAGDTRRILDEYLSDHIESDPSQSMRFYPIELIKKHFSSVKEGKKAGNSSHEPTFSFITSFYGDLEYFRQCALSMSLLISAWEPAGSGTRVEWIIANDDPRIANEKLWKCIPDAIRPYICINGDGKNRGISTRLNQSILASRNEWILFLDSDDTIVPDVVPVLMHYINEFPKCRYISSGIIDIDENNKILRFRRHENPSIEMFGAGMVVGHLKAIRRDVFEEVGMLDVCTDLAQDYDFALRVAMVEPLLQIPDYLYCYRWHHKTQSVSNIAKQNTARDRARRSLVIRMAKRGIFDADVKPQLRIPSNGSKRMMRGACIIRTMGRRLEMMSEAIESVEAQSAYVLPVVVVHGEDRIFNNVTIHCKESGYSAICLQAGFQNRRRGYPANVGLDYVEAHSDEFDYLFFLDDDDIVYPNFAERITEALEYTGADLVYCETNRREPGEELKSGPRLFPSACLLGGNFITSNSFALRISTLMATKVRFDENMEYLEDYKFLLSLLGKGALFVPLFETLSEFRVVGDGNVDKRKFPELFKFAQAKARSTCKDVAKYLGAGNFYASLCSFDFDSQKPLEPSEIGMIMDAKSLFDR